MNDIPPSDNGSLPPDVEEQVDKICDRFEDAWKQGQRPQIEDYLGGVVEPGRPALLHYLVKLDIFYRRRGGENPTAEEYRQRFPELGSLSAVSTLFEIPTPGSVSIGAVPTERYEMGDEIGRGGMGAVFKGRDPELDRDLAIKVLLEEHQDNPDVVQRFLEEPRIGGRLQHPGIVPVYDLGRLSDRRPFFIMKLVEGHTLAERLAERPDHAHDLPRFLKIFEQICQTLAYAHSKGVIHRDLKPRNVMIGAFGEVQVMDWGFAKLLSKEQASALAAGSGASTARGEGTVSRSWTGQVMGTPAYMPPEQARGEVNQLDERCDVFALGAILCVLLTGQPPYRGGREEVLEAAREGNLTDALARLDRCGADADLVGLAKVCLQPRAEDRPRDAGAVAEQVTAYLVGVQERLRQAEMERAAAQAREEEARARAEAEAQARRAERRARQRTLALAASLLLLLSGVGVAGWWYQQQAAAQQRRLYEAQQGLQASLSEASKLREAGLRQVDNPSAWGSTLASAQTALAHAQTLLSQEPDLAETDLAQQVQQAQAQLEADRKVWQLLAAYEQVRLEQSQWDLVRRNFKVAESYPRLQQALADYGLAIGGLDAGEAAAQLRQRPPGVQPYLRAVLEECLDRVPKGQGAQRQWLEAVLAVKSDPWLTQFREAVTKRDWAHVEQLAGQAEVGRYHPAVLAGLARNLPEEARVGGLLLLRRTQQQYPGDFWVNLDLGNALYGSIFASGADRPARTEELPVVNEALAFDRVAVGLRPGNAPAHNNLGTALRKQGDLKGAIACYRKALDLDPKLTPAHYNLGLALKDQGAVKRAIECYTKALDLDPKYPPVHDDLGVALEAQGDLKGAIACFKKALDLDPKYAPAHTNLGLALQGQGDVKGAIECYTKALELDPKLVPAHTNLGTALKEQGDLRGAMACYNKALQLDPKYAPVHTNLGLALQAQGDVQGAIACYKKALDLDPKLVQAHNHLGNALYAQKDWKGATACYKKALQLDPKYAPVHNNLGLALQAQGDVKGATACFHKALDFEPKLVPAHTNLGGALQAQGDVKGAIACYTKALKLDSKDAKTHYNLGTALQAQGDVQGAIACYRKALELDPKDFQAYTNLGAALKAQGDVQGAIACYKKALDLDPKNAKVHNNLGTALQAQGDMKGAIACYKRALDLDPKNAKVHNNLGTALQAQGDVKGAIASYHKALDLEPKDAQAHTNLGVALEAQGDVKGAIACFKKALELDPKYAPALTNLGAALDDQGDLKGAIACYQKALQLDPKDAHAHYNLGNALKARGDVKGAIACYRKALDLDPKYAEAHCNLGHALREQGRFAEALQALKRGHEMGSKRADWRYPSAQWVKGCQQLVDLEGRLTAILNGDEQPANAAEQLALADLCQRYKKRYGAAARFYADAFAAGATQSSQRAYNASCAATLAAAGKGEDAATLDAKEKTRLRQQALAWLKNALQILDKLVEDPERRKEVRQKLQHWQKDPDFDSVRGKEALAQLPEAERAAWQQLWSDVEKLRKQTLDTK
jgi:tetratricopeptide (TPR) repeat protein